MDDERVFETYTIELPIHERNETIDWREQKNAPTKIRTKSFSTEIHTSIDLNYDENNVLTT